MNLGERMKSYENDSRLEKGAVVIRVDGKGFHTWTKKEKLVRPFDLDMHEAMLYASFKTAKEIQGFRLAYMQSDEVSFVLTNLGIKEQGWFDFKVQKLASITVSMFTHYFNKHMEPVNPAFFDARAFGVPIDDLANVIVWRQQDNNRNYIQSIANFHMSRKDVVGKSNLQLVAELAEQGIQVKDLPSWVKFGTFILPGKRGLMPMVLSEYLNYTEINDHLEIKELHDSL